MKKLLVLLAAGLFIFAACSEDKPSGKSNNKPKPVDEPENPPVEEPINEPIQEPDDEQKEEIEFIDTAIELTYASGVGAWSSHIKLYPDGTFTGRYSDTNLGEDTENYSGGTMYISEWQGCFENIKKIDDYTYSLTLKELEYENDIGSDTVENNTHIIYCEAQGISTEIGDEFILHIPGKATGELSESILWWWRTYPSIDFMPESLTDYCLYSLEYPDSAYFSYDY